MCFALRLDSDVTVRNKSFIHWFMNIFKPCKGPAFNYASDHYIMMHSFQNSPQKPNICHAMADKKLKLILQFYSIFNLLNLFSLTEINLNKRK